MRSDFDVLFCCRVDVRVDGLSHLATCTYKYIRFITKYDKNIFTIQCRWQTDQGQYPLGILDAMMAFDVQNVVIDR